MGSEIHYVTVRLPLGGDICEFDYQLGHDLASLPLGTWVKVSLGRRNLFGIVVKNLGCKPSRQLKSIKEIEGIVPLPPLSEGHRNFLNWMSEYIMAPSGLVLKLTATMPKALELLLNPPASRKRKIASFVAPPNDESITPLKPRLSEAQLTIANQLVADARLGGYQVSLLDGVTGSGKTEVYWQAVEEVLASGKQALLLLPEIALSAQFLARARTRFGVEPLVWHSELTPRQRQHTWLAIAKGAAKLVIGARSALFLPFSNLGLIIVDEEHEASYKQQEGLTYQARDMAVVRGWLQPCPVILASATPSLESLRNVELGRYRHLILRDRHGVAQLPNHELIDLRKDQPGRNAWLSPSLLAAIETNLQKGEQALCFLNRRGYAPLTLCRLCGFRLSCPHCSAWLVEHRKPHRLECHHCGRRTAMPKDCPECHQADGLVGCGPGVERLCEELKHHFPHARIFAATSESLANQQQASQFMEAMQKGQIDIVVGTQIIAKGYHFPKLTLVGVIDADMGLSGGDLRAGEKSFQLLTQVGGRAGRAELGGKVYIQTTQPEAGLMQALAQHDRQAFVKTEIANRKALNMPPYGRLAHIIIADRQEARVKLATRILAESIPSLPQADMQIWGPATPAMALLRGYHRQAFLVQATRNTSSLSLQPVIRDWLARAKQSPQFPPRLDIRIDIDPYGFV